MKYALMAACAVIVSAPISQAQDLSQFFSSFIAFGDSLTDDGKFGSQGLPSLEGRFSNGPTYAEIIASDFAVNTVLPFEGNFAIGGATARAENENTLLPAAFGTFGGQVATFSSVVADPTGSALVGDRPLFSVLFGGNDVLQNVGLPDGANPPPGNFLPGVGELAADAVEANIRAIAALDENYNDFLVLNLPDVSQTPLFQNAAFGAGALAPLAALETAGYNNQLAMNIDSLRSDGINIIEFDLNAFSAAQQAGAVLLGIDIETPCTFDLSNPGPEGTCVFAPGEPDDTDLSLANNFFFIDGVHPNALSQAGTAAAIQSAVAAAVPLPAGLPLLLAGLGVFGILRMRRAA